MESIEDLIKQRQEIDNRIKHLTKQKYDKYKDKKQEVADDNPYSRLLALQSMGIVKDYDRMSSKQILIVGVGGVGSVTAEMFVRMGIGRLIIYDYDKVELANMNRLFYTSVQVGLSKVKAAKDTLQFINPDVIIDEFNLDITSIDGFSHLKQQMQSADLVISCVDNYSARMSINLACLQQHQLWIESGVSEDAMSSHIQVLMPGETACFACATPVAVIENETKQIKRDLACAASLPTTMGITAGFIAQCALKILLEFGNIAYVLGYNAKQDFFQNFILSPNPECTIELCQQKQKESDGRFMKQRELINEQRINENEVKREKVENEWQIEIVDTNDQQSIQVQDKIADQHKLDELDADELLNKLKSM